MTTPHEDQSLLTAAAALHALDEQEAQALEAHVETCPMCTAELAGFRETAARLGAAVSETVTPEIVERRQARLMYWGTLARVRYAEAFETEDPLLVDPAAL